MLCSDGLGLLCAGVQWPFTVLQQIRVHGKTYQKVTDEKEKYRHSYCILK